MGAAMTNWKAAVLATVPAARRAKIKQEILDAVCDHATEMFSRYGFVNARRQSSIIGHMAVESTYFSSYYENLRYTTAAAMMRAWPRRFPTVASCAPFLRNPKALANKVYNGRLGNRIGTDDGWNNRGTGLLQQTGAYNMARLAEKMGVTVEQIREMLVSKDHALECACVSYRMHVTDWALADENRITEQTIKINGGKNGLDARISAIGSAYRALRAA